MTNSYVRVIPDSTGKKFQTFENTVSGQDVHAEAVALVDSSGAPISDVYTISVSVVTGNGTVAAGKRHIEFILSTDFTGTIGGAAVTGSTLAIYSPGDAPLGSFAALAYTISAGSAILTTW